MKELHDLIRGKIKQVSLTLRFYFFYSIYKAGLTKLIGEIWEQGDATKKKSEGSRNTSSQTGGISHCCIVVKVQDLQEKWRSILYFGVIVISDCRSPASRWGSPTTRCECCSVSSSSAAMSRDGKRLKSSKVSKTSAAYLTARYSVCLSVCPMFTICECSHH